MTIQEYKAKLDEYLGLVGELFPIADGKWSETYGITYSTPNGVEIVTYRMVRSKIHPMPNGWYESGSRSTFLPDLDPDSLANREICTKKLQELNKKQHDSIKQEIDAQIKEVINEN